MKHRIFSLLIGLFTLTTSYAQFLSEQKDLQSFTGYFDFYYNEAKDEIYLKVDKLNTEFLYVHSLTSGVGSNDIGLDRGQIGDGVVVKFIKRGNKLLLIQPNLSYRAITDNEEEQQSVAQAFATSVLYGFTIKETKEESYIINLTPFLKLDAHGVAQRLKALKQGSFSVDDSRSALQLERTKAFPKNVEFEALITFKGEAKGSELKSVSPDHSFVSVTQHHSFVELPDDNYQKRSFDPRSGAIAMSYMDYSTPVFEPIVKRFIIRHRLEKKNPELPVSEAKEPIIYYLDRGTPEPVRSALLEGGRWWNQAFEAIGYSNAFQVKMLPEGADPMDLRYNMIQWVHRSTRGWSYGASVVDPRTGEILKGHVSLGSLRIRQDFLIAQALLNAPYKDSDDNHQPMLDMALARIRQLSAHEIGHTLGFAHNFAASTNSRASVMDYPHPQVTLKDGTISLENAYDTNIGGWDKVSVAYSYKSFNNQKEEKEQLNRLLDSAYQSGLRFISDQDARPKGGAHELAHLWDNGKSAVQQLNEVLEVRGVAMQNFSADNIRSGEPYAVLEDVFVPLYFFHRYQTEAAVKLIGGLTYNYAVKGDNQLIVKPTEVTKQTEALAAVLKTLLPEYLKIPEDKLPLFSPRAYGYPRTRESFKGKTGVGFDALSAAATASDMTLDLLLHPERASRLVQQHSLDTKQLGLEEVINQLIAQVFEKTFKDTYENEVNNMVKKNTLQHLFKLHASDAYPQVKAVCLNSIKEIRKLLASGTGKKGEIDTFNAYLIQEIENYLKAPSKYKPTPSPEIPDGSPIGSELGCFKN
ncbi:zinc-dependent metalloprotease [Aquimarina brevivitae]|uniref:Uncharacterized protein DUF5117 n=1 Tax=Aquimarina brevivitae TaxID=323412 RepID=A0A4Q7P2J3_9FLAO|nr:zinc-dependent metalloprotease [Aquimarina brevivitae]RZS93600.1 uncharacterized protein DUF5117 [Aquimarina brevivitae]